MPFPANLPAIQDRLANWWEFGEQEAPCLVISTVPDDPAAIPDTEVLETFWTDVDFVIARQMALIEGQGYYGEAVPHHFVNLGASTMPGILGARMEFVDTETIWAYPTLSCVEAVAELELDIGNSIYKLVREITERSTALSHDNHYVTIFPLDGAADAVSAMVGTEGFLMDMILKPEAVERALAAFMRIWVECFEEFAGIIAEGRNAGGIGWAGIWAPGTTFPIQEDCSYMISNEMFRRFCLPHIRAMVDVMDYGFYHLDGIGGLTHLDSLLEIENLKAIQWQPGAGKERLDQWYDVLRHILDQGKSVQVYARPDEIDGLVANVRTRGLLAVIGGATCDEAEMLMEKYGAG